MKDGLLCENIVNINECNEMDIDIIEGGCIWLNGNETSSEKAECANLVCN
jgi:hypothetical protein